ncbi:MAG: NADH-quinone oxidoreductase subunit J [Rickettsiaceae bacterium]|nr:NADH-quinone oxidoreductase subunit J [Rickettsiaceae bacterium]
MALFFYLFSFCIVASSIAVVASRNPVHSVLWLICTFLTSSGLFILLGAEFIAISIVVVYVGAVAVLFLFVVMMLGGGEEETGKASLVRLGFNSLLMLTMIYELCLIIRKGLAGSSGLYSTHLNKVNITNTHAIGEILYTDYIIEFQLCGLILLTAMIGSIVLTLRSRDGVKKQVKGDQLATSVDSVKVKKVKFREGIRGIKY